MKPKTLVLLAFASICGVVAMLGVRKALNQKAPEVETASVLVASVDLGMSAKIDDTNAEFKQVSVDSIPEGAITDWKDCKDRTLKVPVMPGDWITASKLNDEGTFGVVGQIPDGMRVVSVPVNQTTSHSGMMFPGNRVDVMLTYRSRDETGQQIQMTRTVLQRIEIFAVDKTVDGAKANLNELNARNVSVLVTHDDAQTLLLAQAKGDIHLALRSNTDMSEITEGVLTAQDLERGQMGHLDRSSKAERLRAQFGLEELEAGDGENSGPVDLETFVAEASESDPEAEQVTEPVVTVVEPPAKATWQMTIYNGSEATVHGMEIDESEKAAKPADAQSGDKAKSKQPFWRGLIGAFTTGA